MADLNIIALNMLRIASKQTCVAVDLIDVDFPDKLKYGENLVSMGKDMKTKSIAVYDALDTNTVTEELLVSLRDTIEQYQGTIDAAFASFCAHVAIEKAAKL